jgi:two-component system, LuxR family, sensor kinase FixL
MPSLFLVEEGDERLALAVTKPLIAIGRSEQCDIVLPSPLLSLRHAAIIEEDGHYYLEDLNSRNGTCLNGSRISSRRLLEDGDLIQLDDFVLRFCLSAEETRKEPAQPAPPRERDQTNHILATQNLNTDLRLEENAAYKLRAIVELSRNIGVSLDLEAVLPRVLESILEIFPKADRVSLVLLDERDRLIPYASQVRNSEEGDSATIGPISRTVIHRVLSEQIAVLSSDVLSDGRFMRSASVLELGIRSMICAPLIGPSKRPAGVLMADVQELEQPFDERDLDVLVIVARMVAQNMDYVRLHEQLIEERRHAEEMLRKTNVTLQTLINSSPLALFVVNRSGQVQHVWNPAAQAIFGWTPEEIFRQRLKMIHPEDRKQFQRYWQRVWNGQSFTGAEIRCRTKGGDAIDIELSAAALPTHGDPVAEVLFLAADVTELKKTRERMLQKERLAAIGETVASLSHESRNAIYRIQLGIDVLEQGKLEPAEIGAIAKEIREACKDLQYLNEDVRQFGAPIRLEKRQSHLTELVKRVWDGLSGVRGDREARLSIHERINDPSCLVDAVRIEQVFRNLFENSLAACSDPVQIDVTFAPVKGAAAIRVTVGDNGPGLGPEQRQRVFDPFYTTKTNGTGLGMAIVKRIVEAHGGQIAMGKERGRGAEFVMTFPNDLQVEG